MMLVTFSAAMAPHGAGDTRLVSNRMAERLKEQGVLSAAVPYPPSAKNQQQPRKPVRPTHKPSRPTGAAATRKAS